MGGGAAFLGGLFGGLTNSVSDHISQKIADKRALSDEEHNQALSDYNNTANSLQNRMAQIGPKGEGYDDLKQQLAQVHADRATLFHPDQPGGLERLGKMLWTKVHGPTPPATDPARIAVDQTQAAPATQAPSMGGQGVSIPATGSSPELALPNTTPTATPALPAVSGTTVAPPQVQTNSTPAQIKARMPQEMAWGAAAAQPQNPGVVYRQQLAQAFPNMSGEDLDKATQIHLGVAAKPVAGHAAAPSWKLYKLADGTFKNFNLNDPDPDSGPPEGSTPVTAQTQPHQSTSALETFTRSWFPNPNAAQREWAIKRYNRLTHGSTVASHQVLQPDEDGNMHLVTLVSDNHKDFGAEGPPPGDTPAGGASPTAASPAGVSGQAPATPATPAALKKRVPASKQSKASTGAPGSDNIVPGIHRNTSAQNAANKEYSDATALAHAAHEAQNAPPATRAGQQKAVAGTIQRTLEGRYNEKAYDNLIRQYGLANSFKAWISNKQSGALPPEVFNQLVAIADQNLHAKGAARDSAYGKTENEDIDQIVKALNGGK